MTTDHNKDQVTSESVELVTSHVTATDDPDVMTTDSLTLPRIEQVLRSEGVRPLSITQQIDSLRKKLARYLTHCTCSVVAATSCCNSSHRLYCVK